MKINIKFPKYLKYDSEVKELKDKIEEGLNVVVLNKYIDQGDRLTTEQSRIKRLEDEINVIKKTVNKVNIED